MSFQLMALLQRITEKCELQNAHQEKHLHTNDHCFGFSVVRQITRNVVFLLHTEVLTS